MALILSPFSWLLGALNSVFDSYAIAIIIFAVVVKILLFPFSIKGKRGMIQMNMLAPKLQQLKKQYGKDQAKYNEAVQELYMRERINPLSGCLWTLLPLFVLLPLYAVIRQPLFYITNLNELQVLELANLLNWDTVAVDLGLVTQDLLQKGIDSNLKAGFTIGGGYTNDVYNQLYLAGMIPEAGVTLADGTMIAPTNFHFFGLDLTQIPEWKLWQDFSMQNLGRVFLVAISACSGVLFSKITQRTNKLSTNQPQTAQMEQTNKMLMYTMPMMSIWIGFIMPSIMCLYWIANNCLSMVQEYFAGKILKKDYEAARLAAEEQARQEKEEEKRRKEAKSAEITRRQEEEKQNRGKKKKKAPKEKAEQENQGDREASREGLRSYARGRSYDPNRYPNPNLIGLPEGEADLPQVREETSPEEPQEQAETNPSWGLESWENSPSEEGDAPEEMPTTQEESEESDQK